MVKTTTRIIPEIQFTDDELDRIKNGENFILELEDVSRISTTVRVTRGEESFNTREGKSFDIPEVGEQVRDTNPPSWSDDDRMMVTEVTELTAEEYKLEPNSLSGGKTVADDNPSCDPKAPVVMCGYNRGQGWPTGDEYAFPVDRLEF